MKTEDLNYYLPPELIAQCPADNRSDSKLLIVDRAESRLTDSKFSCITQFLKAGDCLVLNNTKVLPARFFAHRATGSKIEGLFLFEHETGFWEVLLKRAGKIKQNELFYLVDKNKKDFCGAILCEKHEQGRCRLKIETSLTKESILKAIGFPPLPPYIKRDDDLKTAEMDTERYQTIYAEQAGAIAAPTAGLHFTEKLITQLKQAEIVFANVTLHVGEGTFKPVTVKNLEDYQIHSERFSLDDENAAIINNTREKGNRVIAVGTTSVRTLETVAIDGRVSPADGSTNLFITPGYEFKIVDAIITNFHLPKSTLLALVAAFSSLENMFAAYRHAIEQRYRFYSYGDAMFII